MANVVGPTMPQCLKRNPENYRTIIKFVGRFDQGFFRGIAMGTLSRYRMMESFVEDIVFIEFEYCIELSLWIPLGMMSFLIKSN